MKNILIINTNCANLSSVKFAFERLGYSAEITNDLNKIKSADKLILPGVGTAKAAMLNLQRLGLVEVIQNLTQPVLGICLGMQLMTEFSTEGNVSTLGLMSGQTELIPACRCLIWAGIACILMKIARYLMALRKTAISILCIAMRYCLMKIPLLPAITAWISPPLSPAITSTAYNSILSVQEKTARCC